MSGLTKLLCRALRINVYEFNGDAIVHYRSLRTIEKIQLADIVSWSVEYEMTFDLVTIELKDGTSVILEDEYNDLLSILRTHTSCENAKSKNTQGSTTL